VTIVILTFHLLRVPSKHLSELFPHTKSNYMPVSTTLGSVLYKSRTFSRFSALNSFLISTFVGLNISQSVPLLLVAPSSLHGVDSQVCSDFAAGKVFILILVKPKCRHEFLCGLEVRVSGYRSTGLGLDSRPYQIF
jgi:hypothetical protein